MIARSAAERSLGPSRRGRVKDMLLLIVLLLAGCAAPAATRGDDAPGAGASRPSSLDVDLHEHVVNIPMPEGQPTMLVALNVTKDMWVRPNVGESLFGTNTPAEDLRFWYLCLWTRSSGLAQGVAGYVAFAFWLDEGRLVTATQAQPRAGMAGYGEQEVLTDDSGGRCYDATESMNRGKAIAAEAPREGTLVVAFGARPDAIGAWDPPASSPSFQVELGIGRRCDDAGSSYFCAPASSIAAEPLLRGPVASQGTYDTFWDPAAECDGCGFEVEDDGGTLGPVRKGALTATRVSPVPIGISIVSGSVGAGSGGALVAATMVLGVDVDGERTEGVCEHPPGGGLEVVAFHERALEIDARFEETGGASATITTLTMPLDIRALGWTATLHKASLTSAPYYAGVEDPRCGWA